jgi:hypothetical protein
VKTARRERRTSEPLRHPERSSERQVNPERVDREADAPRGAEAERWAIPYGNP